MGRMQEGQSRCAEVTLFDRWRRTGTIPKPTSPPNRLIQVEISTTNIDSFKLVLWPECNPPGQPGLFSFFIPILLPTLPILLNSQQASLLNGQLCSLSPKS